MLHLRQIIPEKAGLERALRAVRAARRRYRAVRTYLERPTRSVSRIPAHEKNRGMYAFREMERLAGIWSSSLYDRPKRSMLEALLSPLVVDDFIAFPDFLEDIKWILSETDKIEEIRNNAVHAPLKMDLRPGVTVDHFLHGKAFVVAPNVEMKNIRELRLLQKHPGQITLLKEVRWARDASALLRDFTQRIVWALTDDEHPWPRRPSLPNRGQKKTREIGKA